MLKWYCHKQTTYAQTVADVWLTVTGDCLSVDEMNNAVLYFAYDK